MKTATQREQELRAIDIADEMAIAKTDGLQIDLEIELERNQAKYARLETAKIQTAIEQEVTAQTGYKLDSARIDTDIAALSVKERAITLGMASDSTIALEARRIQNRHRLVAQHRSAQLEILELEASTDHTLEVAQRMLGSLPDLPELPLLDLPE